MKWAEPSSSPQMKWAEYNRNEGLDRGREGCNRDGGPDRVGSHMEECNRDGGRVRKRGEERRGGSRGSIAMEVGSKTRRVGSEGRRGGERQGGRWRERKGERGKGRVTNRL